MFFNAPDRKHEDVYIASLAFPETRIASLRSGNPGVGAAAQVLLQLAVQGGAAAVEHLAGLHADPRLAEPVEMLQKQFAAAAFDNGWRLAQVGALNQRGQPGMELAVKLLETDLRRRSSRATHELSAGPETSIGGSIAQTIARCTRTDG